MVLDAIVIEDVGTDLRSPPAFHRTTGRFVQFGLATFFFELFQLGLQDRESLTFVLPEVTESRSNNLDARGLVHHPAGRGNLVHVLTAGSG